METDYDDEFLIRANNGQIYLKIETVYGFPNSTSHFGGYDTKSRIEITSSNYSVIGTVFITTGEIFEFYKQLRECYDLLTGTAKLTSYEGNLELSIVFDGLGHAEIQGFFREESHLNNKLEFELTTDQTYLFQAISGLTDIIDKYGDNMGKSSMNSA